MTKHHPRQPTYRDAHGVKRFKGNSIIRWLADTRRLDLNLIATMGFPREDHRQLAQLLGYSVDGYNDLSYVQDEKEETP